MITGRIKTHVDPDLFLLGKELMLCHLLTLIIGYKKSHLFRQCFHLPGNNFSDGFSIPLFQGY